VNRSCLVAQRLSIQRLTGLERLMVEGRRRPLPRHGTDHDSKPLPLFPRFCLPARPLQCRQEEYRSGRATAQGIGRSLLALPFAGAPLRPARRTRFEFIPLWGFLVFLQYTMRRVNCRRCGIVAVEEVPWCDGKRTQTKAYMLFLARWAWRLSWRKRRRKPFAPPGIRSSTRWNTLSPSGWSTGCWPNRSDRRR